MIKHPVNCFELFISPQLTGYSMQAPRTQDSIQCRDSLQQHLNPVIPPLSQL